VHAFNQRDIAGILAMIRTIGALVGALVEAEALAQSYEARLGDVAALVRGRPKPKVYFEEWDGPLISGVGGSRNSSRSPVARISTSAGPGFMQF